MIYRQVGYVRRGDPGDLLMGYHWRKAVLVDDGDWLPSINKLESNMFDLETGENVGDTYNLCVRKNDLCEKVGCVEHKILAEVL